MGSGVLAVSATTRLSPWSTPTSTGVWENLSAPCSQVQRGCALIPGQAGPMPTTQPLAPRTPQGELGRGQCGARWQGHPWGDLCPVQWCPPTLDGPCPEGSQPRSDPEAQRITGPGFPLRPPPFQEGSRRMSNSQVNYNYGQLQLGCHRNPLLPALSVGPLLLDLTAVAGMTPSPSFQSLHKLRREFGGEGKMQPQSLLNLSHSKPAGNNREKGSLHLDLRLGRQGALRVCLCIPGRRGGGSPRQPERQGLWPCVSVSPQVSHFTSLSQISLYKMGWYRLSPQFVRKIKWADARATTPGLDKCQPPLVFVASPAP